MESNLNTMADNYPVKKCVCFNTTFKEMKTIMDENGIKTIEELKQLKQLADNCKFCVPYINLMIETGKTEFEIIK